MASRILITNAWIFDGSGTPAFPGEVLVEGQRIAAVGRGAERLPRESVEQIDAGGAVLIPGLIEAHAHLGFGATVDRPLRWRELDVERQRLVAAEAGRTMLDFGFTSAYSGGATNARWEVALRDEFAAGWLPGPRLRACSFERSASAVSGTRGSYSGAGARVPDSAGVADFVREMIGIGVDAVKFVLSGESAIRPGTSRITQFHDEELAAGTQLAHEAGVWLNAHCHSTETIKQALRHGFRVLYHCTWADDEATDLLEAHKEQIFVAPGPGVNYAAIYEASAFGITHEMAVEQEQVETLERVSKLMPELRRRGVRVLPGGDYGFPWNPIGRNARDMELFVTHFGFTPAQALSAGTMLGGQIMGMGDELGLIRPGYLADLLLIDGDPLKDIRLLQDRARLLLIMKDGGIHKHSQRTQNNCNAEMAASI